MEKKFTDGWRGRIGLVATAPGNATEADFNKYRPEGVAVMTTRTPLKSSTPEGILEMDTYIDAAAQMLASNAYCDVILLSSTAGSFIAGTEGDNKKAAELSESLGCKVITSAQCMLKALDAFSVKNIALITPSSAELNKIEVEYLKSAGIKVVSQAGFLLTSPRDILCISQEEIIKKIRACNTDAAEAIVLSCSGLHAMEIIETIENEINKPVIASNQFGLWGCLKELGITDSVSNAGSLFNIRYR